MRNANHACKFFPGSLSTFSHREGQLVVAASCRKSLTRTLTYVGKVAEEDTTIALLALAENQSDPMM